MKKILIILFAIYGLQAHAQSGNHAGEIKSICLDLKMTDEQNNIAWLIRINNRKIIATKKASGIQTGKKVIKVDKKLYNTMKHALFTKSNMYALPDIINCRQCRSGIQVALSVKTKAGKKNISGKDPQEENADMKYIINYITDMVGTIDDK